MFKSFTNKNWILHASLLAVFSTMGMSNAMAQEPDAGSLLRDTESTLLKQGTEFGYSMQPVLEQPDVGVKVLINSIEVSGYESMVSQNDIVRITDAYIGKELGFNGLQHIADLITAHLKSKGFFLAFAYLPKQDLSAGHLKILVQPGQLDGSVNILDAEGVASKEQLEGILNYHIGDSVGTVLHAQRIETAMLTMNDLAGVTASMNLEKGSQRGTTKVDLNIMSTPKLNGMVWTDNQGSYYTGGDRLNAMAQINNLSGRGDSAGVMASVTEGQTYARLNYSAMVHSSGLKLDASLTNLEYELGQELAVNDSQGESNVYSIGLTYPLMRTRQQSIFAESRYDHKAMKDSSQGLVVRDRVYDSLVLALKGYSSDRTLGGGQTSFDLSTTLGDLDLSGNADNLQSDQSSFETNGSFNKMNYSLSRFQRFDNQWSVFASIKGQIAGGNLDSAEKFSLSGPVGVRAYASGESSGDEGWLASVETRYDVPRWNFKGATLQLKAFLDTGSVTLSKDGYTGYTPANNNELNEYSLTGVGLGAILRKSNEFELSATYAQQINPEVDDRTTTGLDSERSNDEYRVWLQAKAWF